MSEEFHNSTRMQYAVQYRNKRRTYASLVDALICGKNWDFLARADEIQITNEFGEIVWFGTFEQLNACARGLRRYALTNPRPMKLSVHIGSTVLTYESYSDLVRNGQKIMTKASKFEGPIQLKDETDRALFEGTVFELIFFAADKAGEISRPAPKVPKKRKREPVDPPQTCSPEAAPAPQVQSPRAQIV